MTTRVMLHQENMLSLNHATPWVALSSSVGPDVVTAGPGRMIALAAACVIGLVAWRRRPTLLGLVWLAALALALRCFFESVMVPFYLGPPFALALLAVAARPGWRRPALAAAGALGGIVLSFRHIGEWGYWLLDGDRPRRHPGGRLARPRGLRPVPTGSAPGAPGGHGPRRAVRPGSVGRTHRPRRRPGTPDGAPATALTDRPDALPV